MTITVNNPQINTATPSQMLTTTQLLPFLQVGTTKEIPIQALRFNESKIRYDLLEPYAIEQLAAVFTKGAEKYADRNWEHGMAWTKMLASLKRHIAAFENGEDFDKETGLLHMAHAAWNAMGLVSYMKHHPEFDDRSHKYLRHPKIGIDIDNVICDWTKGWGEKYGIPQRPEAWQFSYANKNRFLDAPKEELEKLYLGLPKQCEPHHLPFEPCAYVTARSIDENITKAWLENHGFPTAPVYSVPFGKSKIEAIKNTEIEWFIDDSYENFVELNRAGICCFLFDAAHNQRYDVGYKRIKNFDDFKNRFL